MSDLTKEYNDLLDVKVGLDAEIKAYDKMLGGEETRMAMSQPSSPTDSATPRRGTW
jgi:hypothetical protein